MPFSEHEAASLAIHIREQYDCPASHSPTTSTRAEWVVETSGRVLYCYSDFQRWEEQEGWL